MHSATPDGAVSALGDAAGLILHLAHELRQPLSGIESAAYYLDMVVSDARPDLIPHCRRLRAMVQQANWLLEDATLCALLPAAVRGAQALGEALRRAGNRLFAEEEAVLDLHLEAEGLVEAPELLARLVGHLVAFFRDVAGCADPIHAGVRREGEWVLMRLWADGSEDAEDAARMMRSSAGCGFLGRFLALAGGRFEAGAEASGGRLELMVWLPACAEQGA